IDVTGHGTRANAKNGVLISSAAKNTIGGTAAGARNVISGNRGSGVLIGGVAATGNVLQANYIGTDVTGTRALGNVGSGVTLTGHGNTIGGVAGAGNGIASKANYGIDISRAADNLVQGNLIRGNPSAGIIPAAA